MFIILTYLDGDKRRNEKLPIIQTLNEACMVFKSSRHVFKSATHSCVGFS